ncbi:MAG: 1-deoxy-D-xylulose-5-phosphate reductoisomerase [Ruminococcaceae bacterium]|nr:1-deoxy-D-xylulose-5-phosphate reductoisomerase [Oscillospiraceae bacterium]
MNYEYPSISILGSTGSVGEQAIDVALKNGIRVNCLSANKNVARVETQARELGVKACAMADRDAARDLEIKLADTDIKVYTGIEGICEMISEHYEEREVVVNSIIGEAGLRPTLAVLGAGKKLALANKESLVCAGEFVMKLAQAKRAEILPVDSEHSAIFQALRAGEKKEIKRLLLTASGGPFYGMSREALAGIRVEDALAHPTWNMGAKITIDSATLMNKGFEVIEAVHLFGVSADQIEVLVHRESIMHSAIEYIDNSVIAQMSVPDMRLCVQYALTHPARTEAVIPTLDLTSIGKMTFAKPDTDTFTLLKLAFSAVEKGGAVPAVLNAANEVAVAAFLDRRLDFLGIFDVVIKTVKALPDAARIRLMDDIFAFDGAARSLANEFLTKRSALC